MAGVLPPKRNSGRKQWTINDGSLKRLRNHLATEGCAESQVVLAKQLLGGTSHEGDNQVEDEKLGVYWLVRASEQGSEEAVDLLQDCLRSGRGITHHNLVDVRRCVDMSRQERLARQAATNLFNSLSNGAEYITTEQLQKRMLQIINKEDLEPSNEGHLEVFPDKNQQSSIDWREARVGKKLTEQAIVEAAVQYTEGNLPLLTSNLPDVSRPDTRALAQFSWVQRGLYNPILAVSITSSRVISGMSFYGGFASQILFMAILPLLWLSWVEPDLRPVLSAVCLYTSLGVMLWCTARWLDTERRLEGEFSAWGHLLLAHNEELNIRAAERLYLRRSLGFAGPIFAVALLALVSSWGSASTSGLLAHGELMAFASFIALLTLSGKLWAALLLGLLGFINFYAHEYSHLGLPMEPLAGWFAWPCLAALLATPLGPLHTKTLLSLLVALAWLQVATVCWSANVPGSLAGAFRASLVLSGVVFCVPLLGVSSAFLPAFAAFRWFHPPLVATATGGLIWLLTCATAARNERIARGFGRVQVLSAVLALFFLLAHAYRTITLDHKMVQTAEPQMELSWEAYREVCHQPAWDKFGGNTAAVQQRCHQLLEVHKNRLRVNWQGYINEVRVTKVKNIHMEWTSKLPTALQDAIRCALASNTPHPIADLPEIWHNLAESQCSLHHFDRYTHEILVKMQAGLWGGKSAELKFEVGHIFTNFTSRLRSNDKVYFSGVIGYFENDNKVDFTEPIAGGFSPKLVINEIGCLACHDPLLSFYRIPSVYDYWGLVRAIFYNLLPPNPFPQFI